MVYFLKFKRRITRNDVSDWVIAEVYPTLSSKGTPHFQGRFKHNPVQLSSAISSASLSLQERESGVRSDSDQNQQIHRTEPDLSQSRLSTEHIHLSYCHGVRSLIYQSPSYSSFINYISTSTSTYLSILRRQAV